MNRQRDPLARGELKNHAGEQDKYIKEEGLPVTPTSITRTIAKLFL